MASFGIIKLNGQIIELPGAEIGTFSPGTNIIACSPGDFVIVEQANKSTPSDVSITSGGSWVVNTGIYWLIKCTASSLVLNYGSVSALGWHTLIKQPKTNFTSATQITNNTEVTNLPKDAIVYGNGWSGAVTLNKFTNIVFYASGTPASGTNSNPIVGYVVSSTNDIKMTSASNYLSACYLS